MSSSASLTQHLILPPLEGSSSSAWPAAAALVHRASYGVNCFIEKIKVCMYYVYNFKFGLIDVFIDKIALFIFGSLSVNNKQ